MITEIAIENFKSLRNVKLELGHFNLFIGANASGKSNFFDALRVLQGIGYGFTIDEIFNGKPKSLDSEAWEEMRGGSLHALSEVAREGKPAPPLEDLSLFVSIRLRKAMPQCVGYRTLLSPIRGTVLEEEFCLEGAKVFFGKLTGARTFSADLQLEVQYLDIGSKGANRWLVPHSTPAIRSLSTFQSCLDEHREAMRATLQAMSNMQRLNPSVHILRDFSPCEEVKRMGERGENFAALVKAILADPMTREAYVSWLQNLTPDRLDDVIVLSGALNEPMFAVREHGLDRPAPILSDGTLRFAAIVAAFFQPDMPDIITIEEIGNSIHPSRLRLLLELLKSQSKEGPQVFATTHSPTILAWLEEEDYEHTFFCKRDEETGESLIKPLSEIPRFLDVVKRHPISELFTGEWMESAF